MVYKNVNRRILILARMGLIEEIKYTERTPHGRIDYNVNMNGLIELIPEILFRPEEAEHVMKHMERFGLDKEKIAELINDKLFYMESVSDLFYGRVKLSDYQRKVKGAKEWYDERSSKAKLRLTEGSLPKKGKKS